MTTRKHRTSSRRRGGTRCVRGGGWFTSEQPTTPTSSVPASTNTASTASANTALTGSDTAPTKSWWQGWFGTSNAPKPPSNQQGGGRRRRKTARRRS